MKKTFIILCAVAVLAIAISGFYLSWYGLWPFRPPFEVSVGMMNASDQKAPSPAFIVRFLPNAGLASYKGSLPITFTPLFSAPFKAQRLFFYATAGKAYELYRPFSDRVIGMTIGDPRVFVGTYQVAVAIGNRTFKKTVSLTTGEAPPAIKIESVNAAADSVGVTWKDVPQYTGYTATLFMDGNMIGEAAAARSPATIPARIKGEYIVTLVGFNFDFNPSTPLPSQVIAAGDVISGSSNTAR